MAKERDIRDHWFRMAKREGYRSRAAYKLREIQERRSVLRPGDVVLDCGCAPGSWLQVAARLVGERGRVVGIDLKTIRPLDMGSGGFEHVTVMQGDLETTPAADLLAPTRQTAFDVVLSDMAPSTTGDRTIDHHGSMRLCHAVLDRAADLLRPGGTVVLKAFEGTAYPELLERLRREYDAVKGFKPKASRAISTEMYLIGSGKRAGRDATTTGTGTGAGIEADEAFELAPPPPPRPKPKTGWGR